MKASKRGPQFNRLNQPVDTETANNRLSDGTTVCSRIAQLGRISEKTWSNHTLRFFVAVWSLDIYALRMSIIKATLDTEFDDIQVADDDTSVMPAKYRVTMKWTGRE